MNLLEDVQRLVQEERLGHAYLINGDPGEEGKRFAESMAVEVLRSHSPLPEAQIRHRVTTRIHPDVHWVEPRGKLRQIKVDDVAHALKNIHEKSFEGGWKLVGFLGAERLNPSSGNKLLKSLEEPPPRTLILLVTETPEKLLPTLRSRCQWLSLPPEDNQQEPDWLPALLGLLASGPPRNLRNRLERAAAFCEFFAIAVQDELGDDGEEALDEDVQHAREAAARRQLQRRVMEAVEAWYRDVLVCRLTPGQESPLNYPDCKDILQEQAGRLEPKWIHKLLENVRRAAGDMEGNLPLQVVFEGTVF